MSPEELLCDLAGIDDFLAGRLGREDQTRLESHLDRCPTCRRRLEESAADDEQWTEAAIHLRDDELDLAPSGVEAAPASGECSGQPTRSFEAERIAAYFDPTDDPRMLGRFGGYEVVGIVGCGGMGVVLKGYEPALDRYVAIKALAPHLATSAAARARFAREARAAAAVRHDNVVAIHRVSEANGLPYLVMPYIPGDSLQTRLDARGPLQLVEILRIGAQIADGLAAAHAQGLVHRDIKPGNILLDSGVERVTITDFGLARAADDASLTRSGVIAGTPQYMSPEQARGDAIDGRSDLFSLGSVLYALCTGRPPFRAETAYGVLRRITESPPRPIRDVAPEIPEWFCEIVARIHAKDPAQRFLSAAEVADLLGRWLAHVQQPTSVPAPLRLSRRRGVSLRTHSPSAVWTTATTLALVGLVVSVTAWLTRDGAMASRNEDSAVSNRTVGTNVGRDAAELAALSDDRSLDTAIREGRQQAQRLQRQWLEPTSDDGNRWSPGVTELRRQAEGLRQQIERNLPAAERGRF